MKSRAALGACLAATAAAGACDVNDDGSGGGGGLTACAADNGGITLPPGFCASVFADQIGRARHMAVTSTGDVFVAIAPPPKKEIPARVVALRDADGDGKAEIIEQALEIGGNGIAWQNDALFVATSDQIVRFALGAGSLVPERPEVIVSGMPKDGDHAAKTVVVAGDAIYVNRGSGTNSCQERNRELHSPGIDPCPELAVRAGVWRYAAGLPQQVADDGVRFATGVRNANALAVAPDGALWAAVNGRDQLHENWPELFTEAQDLQLPSEEIAQLRQGEDRGWPYCYHDPIRDDMMLAPEYGGDGTVTGRCETVSNPQAWLPAHWAPLGAVFYTGAQFPGRYRGGMFVANHGSRFDMQNETGNPGYNVVFVPFENGQPGAWEEFAGGFTAGLLPLPEAAPHRPVAVAEMPDGALLISDDQSGRIWRVVYQP